MVFEGKRGAKAGKTVLRILTTPNEGTKSREIMQTTRSKATQKQNILRTSLIVLSACLVGALSLAAPALAASKGQQAPEVDGRDKNTYTEEEVINAGKEFLGGTAQGLANVVHKIFAEFGEPNAYIRGEEAGGAIGVGLMYGDGLLVMKNGTSQKVYWQGPSVDGILAEMPQRSSRWCMTYPQPKLFTNAFQGLKAAPISWAAWA
jgi:hypothetical protein